MGMVLNKTRSNREDDAEEEEEEEEEERAAHRHQLAIKCPKVSCVVKNYNRSQTTFNHRSSRSTPLSPATLCLLWFVVVLCLVTLEGCLESRYIGFFNCRSVPYLCLQCVHCPKSLIQYCVPDSSFI